MGSVGKGSLNPANSLQNFAGGFGLGITKEKLADRAYTEMKKLGYDAAVLNEKYLTVNGTNYQFIKDRKTGSWKVREF